MRHTTLSLGLFAATALIAGLTAPSAMAFGPQETIHFNTGDTKTNCRVTEIVGTQFTYRCPGQGWTIFNRNTNTATRLLLAGPQDTLTLKNGDVLTGEVMFKDYEHYEIKTDTGLKQVRNREVTKAELGLTPGVQPDQPAAQPLPGAYQDDAPAAADDATTPAEPLGSSSALPPVNGLLLAVGMDDSGATGQPMSPADDIPGDVQDPADAGDTVGAPPMDMPSADLPADTPATTTAVDTPTPNGKPARTPRSAKPIRRLITPMTSPWKIDKPYGGDDTLY